MCSARWLAGRLSVFDKYQLMSEATLPLTSLEWDYFRRCSVYRSQSQPHPSALTLCLHKILNPVFMVCLGWGTGLGFRGEEQRCLHICELQRCWRNRPPHGDKVVGPVPWWAGAHRASVRNLVFSRPLLLVSEMLALGLMMLMTHPAYLRLWGSWTWKLWLSRDTHRHKTLSHIFLIWFRCPKAHLWTTGSPEKQPREADIHIK